MTEMRIALEAEQAGRASGDNTAGSGQADLRSFGRQLGGENRFHCDSVALTGGDAARLGRAERLEMQILDASGFEGRGKEPFREARFAGVRDCADVEEYSDAGGAQAVDQLTLHQTFIPNGRQRRG